MLNPLIRKSIFLCLFFIVGISSVSAEEFAVPNGVATIEWRSEFSEQEKNFLKQWLAKASHTASQLAGSFPRKQSRIRIERASGRRSSSRWPVPWGQTMRRGMDGVLFQVNTEKSMDEYINDWTAAHEFSHLFIPYPGQKDIWLSEGFASYYQNILMAREGLYTPETAWQKLFEGYKRAEQDRNTDYTLTEVSAGRRQFRSTMRVYWSGALFFMEADITIRLATDNQRSLDWIVNEYINCCRDNKNSWNGQQMLEAFDQVLSKDNLLKNSMNANYFSNLYARYSNSQKIPDSESIFNLIGIRSEGNKLVFEGDAKTTALREDFTKARIEPLKMPAQ